MRDRYSILVGAALPRDRRRRHVNTLGGGCDEETLGLDKLAARWPLPEFAVPAAAAQLEGDANVAQDDCGSGLDPLPRRPAARPACRARPRRARSASATSSTSRLVISFWFTKGDGCVDQQDVVDDVYAALPWAGELPLAGRARRPRHGPRTGRGTRLADAGRLRPRRRRRRPLPGRRLPDLRLRLPRRHPAERQHRRPRPRRSSSRACAGCCAATARGRGAGADGAPANARSGGSRPRSRAGWRPTSPPSSPASGSPGSRSSAGRGRSPEPVRRRLRDLSDRFYGSHAIHMRERPIPWAYRVFFRQIGLDPDRTRTPVEQLALDRLHDGGFKSRGLPRDALTIAIVETGVALRAFDADALEGGALHPRLGPGRVARRQRRRAARRGRW